MNQSENLTQSQYKALCEYINSNHLIINSGRRSGKSKTLIEVFKFWLNYQMKSNDTCVIIGYSNNANKYFMENIMNELNVNSNKFYIRMINPIAYQLIYNNKVCYIRTYSNIIQHFMSLDSDRWKGIVTDITLMLGDERYISDDWCGYTACAFTQRKKVMTLEYPDNIKEKMMQLMQIYNINW